MYLQRNTGGMQPAGMRSVGTIQGQEVACRRDMQVLGNAMNQSRILECSTDVHAIALCQQFPGAAAPVYCLAPLAAGAACTSPWPGRQTIGLVRDAPACQKEAVAHQRCMQVLRFCPVPGLSSPNFDPDSKAGTFVQRFVQTSAHFLVVPPGGI